MKIVFLKFMLILVVGIFLSNSAVLAQEMDHSKMDHSKMTSVPEKVPETEPMHQGMDHSMMDHSKMDHTNMSADMPMALVEPNTPIPAVTDADRTAAFPKVDMHAMHGESAIQSMLLIAQFEVWDASPGAGLAWDAVAWVGSDINRLWLRTEGEYVDSRLESAELEVLVGRSVAPWWDLLVGVRHDFKPGQSQDFLAVGVMGLSPYKFETDITLYLGENGQSAARLQFEYETLFTNRLILQPKIEMNFYGKDDPARGIGSGLSDSSLGLRLRYEINRQFAPYIGVSWEKAYGKTADYLQNEEGKSAHLKLLTGVRVWF
jgi:copper resistance protein B